MQITELKDYFEDEHDPIERNAPATKVPDPDGPDLLFGCSKYVNKQEILAAIPSRPIVDRLVSKYFNTRDIVPGMLIQLAKPSFLWLR